MFGGMTVAHQVPELPLVQHPCVALANPTMKSSKTAMLLNFVIPGAGLWYLGMTRGALLNLVVAMLIPMCGFFWLSEHVHYLFLAVAAGSAGLAHAVASQLRVESPKHAHNGRHDTTAEKTASR